MWRISNPFPVKGPMYLGTVYNITDCKYNYKYRLSTRAKSSSDRWDSRWLLDFLQAKTESKSMLR